MKLLSIRGGSVAALACMTLCACQIVNHSKTPGGEADYAEHSGLNVDLIAYQRIEHSDDTGYLLKARVKNEGDSPVTIPADDVVTLYDENGEELPQFSTHPAFLNPAPVPVVIPPKHFVILACELPIPHPYELTSPHRYQPQEFEVEFLKKRLRLRIDKSGVLQSVRQR